MTERAVSSTLNYVLSLGIATLLLSGLLLAGGGFVEDRREQVIRSELRVIGQQLASEITRADRLVTAGDAVSEAELRQSLPERIAGSTYDVSLSSSPTRIELGSTRPEVSVSVHLVTETSVRASDAGGGVVVVQYESGKLEVTNG